MVKFKTTDREIKEGFARVIRIGYCEAQYLLNFENAIAYNCGAYGWKYDVYIIEGYCSTCIVTGYSPCGNIQPNYEILRKFEEKAEKIRHNNGITYEQKAKKTKKLLKNFIDYCIKEYEEK